MVSEKSIKKSEELVESVEQAVIVTVLERLRPGVVTSQEQRERYRLRCQVVEKLALGIECAEEKAGAPLLTRVSDDAG